MLMHGIGLGHIGSMLDGAGPVSLLIHHSSYRKVLQGTVLDYRMGHFGI